MPIHQPSKKRITLQNGRLYSLAYPTCLAKGCKLGSYRVSSYTNVGEKLPTMK